jgi:SOS-response transcriptional repressor LexA
VLSQKQLRLMHFIAGVVDARDASPTYSEIMDALPMFESRTNVFYNLRVLEREGFIKIVPRRRRGIAVLKRPEKTGIYRNVCPCCLRDWPRGEA